MIQVLEAIGLVNGAVILITLNFIAFASFGIDKRKAEAGTRRIAESTLLMWALLGGTPGAYAGRKAFRHKTRKQPFCRKLHRIAVFQVLALAGLGWWWSGLPVAPAEVAAWLRLPSWSELGG